RSRGIVRSLDGWVARLIGFTEARANYYMLLQLPERLGEHAERLKAAAEAAEGALEAVWRARAGKAGLTRRRDLLEEKRAALAGMDEAIAAAHDQRSDVEAARER